LIIVSPSDGGHGNSKDTYFETAFRQIYMWLHIAFLYAPVTCSQDLTIYLYLTKLKKLLPKKGEPITENNVNTAFTFSCKPKNEINIFREEEWFKVLIHETMHAVGLDFSEFDHTTTNKKILELFPVKSDVRLFETYCETWAELLNILFLTFFYTKKKDKRENIPEMYKNMMILLEIEKSFSMFQLVKVLDFYGLTYDELCDKTSVETHQKRLVSYKEDTHVLSYYILKSICLFHLDAFLEWCIKHNGGFSLNFGKSKKVLVKNLDDYCSFIREHYKKQVFLENIYSIPRGNKKAFEYQTMRMTVFG
jgi:hypothetical protein